MIGAPLILPDVNHATGNDTVAENANPTIIE
jgi:hypothetical protein